MSLQLTICSVLRCYERENDEEVEGIKRRQAIGERKSGNWYSLRSRATYPVLELVIL